MTEREEINAEADRIERNRKKCPGTCKIAELLFDARDRAKSALEHCSLEDLAITVDGIAQAGHEVGPLEAAAIFEMFLKIQERTRP